MININEVRKSIRTVERKQRELQVELSRLETVEMQYMLDFVKPIYHTYLESLLNYDKSIPGAIVYNVYRICKNYNEAVKYNEEVNKLEHIQLRYNTISNQLQYCSGGTKIIDLTNPYTVIALIDELKKYNTTLCDLQLDIDDIVNYK